MPAGAQPAAPATVPTLQARVTDMTGTLDAARRQALDQRLAALEQRKGAQVAVLMVPSTAPDTIEQYATRVFDQWKLGRKNTDDGVLLVVAKDDRALRIEVGYGLEGAIPDAMAGRIIREQIVPHLQAGDFAAGIDAGVAAIEKLIDGESLPPPAQAQDDGQAENWPFFLMLGAFMLGLPAIVAGLAVAAVSWMTFGTWWAAALGGVGGFAVSGLLGVLGIKRRLLNSARRGGRGGGGGFGGGFGGGRGGGGGFGGGGGRSGGGGASGRW
ncbi:MAG TPA: YgcG family protein [Bordetella sp.]|nr:YgcG family protein [Bordetella sp.]